MADQEDKNTPLEVASTQEGDVDMAESNAEGNDDTPAEGAGEGDDAEVRATQASQAIEEVAVSRIPFSAYLSSPVATLVVGSGENETVLSAHQSLLAKSPYFAEMLEAELDDSSPTSIDLSSDDPEAVGSFLEFLYTGDYFPRKVPGQRSLETDPSIPTVDMDGAQLLKHARVYTLADRFGVPQLKSLASNKIHCVSSTAKGEIAYARYVYEFTTKDDAVVRAPIISFWASRSHTLRAEAEDEFRSLCLEFPEFGYDVLSRVLDEKLKRERNEKMHPQPGSARKRARQSTNA